MPLYRVFDKNVTIQYKNTLCSKAMFFVWIVTLVTFTAPLIIAYRSRGFWLKNHVYYEQPDVHFKYQYLLIAETEDLNYTIVCGTWPKSTQMLRKIEDCFFVKVREVDNTYDRKIDEIHFLLSVSNLQLKTILSIQLFMMLDYKLHGLCPLQMESLIIHRQEFGLSVAKHFVTANLELNQVAALPCWNNYKDIQFNHSVVPSLTNVDDYNLEEMIYSYSRRNFSTALGNKYTTTNHGKAPVFEFEILVAIPEHAIRYKPGLWQELKHSWQQYLSIALIFYWLTNKIKAYVFTNEMLHVWKNIPWKK